MLQEVIWVQRAGSLNPENVHVTNPKPVAGNRGDARLPGRAHRALVVDVLGHIQQAQPDVDVEDLESTSAWHREPAVQRSDVRVELRVQLLLKGRASHGFATLSGDLERT